MFRCLVIGLAAFVLIASACSSDSQTTSEGTENASNERDLSQTASAGGIDVKATWQASDTVSDDVDVTDYPADRFLYLEVKLDTHSGDLMSIEFPASAEFRQGDKQFGPAAWAAAKDDAHHREGLLIVPREFEEGSVELVLQLGDNSLSLEWGSVPQA